MFPLCLHWVPSRHSGFIPESKDMHVTIVSKFVFLYWQCSNTTGAVFSISWSGWITNVVRRQRYRQRTITWQQWNTGDAKVCWNPIQFSRLWSVPLTLVLPDALQRCPHLMEKAVDSVTTRHINSTLVKLQLYQSLWLHLPNWAKTFTVNWITPAA